MCLVGSSNIHGDFASAPDSQAESVWLGFEAVKWEGLQIVILYLHLMSPLSWRLWSAGGDIWCVKVLKLEHMYSSASVRGIDVL